MTKPNILIQLDADSQASTFDAVVAVDAGIDQLFTRSSVAVEDVEALTHGAMFTRGPDDLKHTAIFVGGSDVQKGEALLDAVTSCFFGPMRVSVMLDANGANTTASAAVIAASRHLDLGKTRACVLASTGPVGQRIVQLLAKQGAKVVACSRKADRAEEVCKAVRKRFPESKLHAAASATSAETAAALEGCQVVFAAGAAGVELLSQSTWQVSSSLKVAIDLNAVAPAGIEGIGVMDKATEKNAEQGAVTCYGAIGVGGTKMKIHKEAIRRLFQANDQVFNAEELFELGMELEQS